MRTNLDIADIDADGSEAVDIVDYGGAGDVVLAAF